MRWIIAPQSLSVGCMVTSFKGSTSSEKAGKSNLLEKDTWQHHLSQVVKISMYSIKGIHSRALEMMWWK